MSFPTETLLKFSAFFKEAPTGERDSALTMSVKLLAKHNLTWQDLVLFYGQHHSTPDAEPKPCITPATKPHPVKPKPKPKEPFTQKQSPNTKNERHLEGFRIPDTIKGRLDREREDYNNTQDLVYILHSTGTRTTRYGPLIAPKNKVRAPYLTHPKTVITGQVLKNTGDDYPRLTILNVKTPS